MMSSQEQSTKKSKLMCVEFCVEVAEDMTPNILTPLVKDAFKDIGVISARGIIYNHKDYESADQVNCVVINDI